MHVRFWGTRGSIAKAGPSTIRYGGNTSCVELRTDHGTLFVLDCGTGAHGLGQDLLARGDGQAGKGHLLVSHTHWDHIQGLPFFAPLFQPGNRWHVYGPRGLSTSILETLAGQMEYSYFPITLDQLQAEVQYHDLVEGHLNVDDTTIVTHYLNHPALTLGFRLEADGASVVYASDHEPHHGDVARGGDFGPSPNDRRHVEFLAGADLVIHDTQYLAEEYPDKVGWGHSTMEYVVDACILGGVKRLALFHHDPTRDDVAVDLVLERAHERVAAAGATLDVVAAAEGRTIEVRGDGTTPRSGLRNGALRRPAMEQVALSAMICAADPEVRGTLTAAADAEGIDTYVTAEIGEAVDHLDEVRPSVLMTDHSPDETVDLAAALGSSDPGVTVITVRRSGEPPIELGGVEVADQLQWPAGLGHVRTKLRAWMLRRACRWQVAAQPDDEAHRIEALQDLAILDTDPEERFDRFTREASELLGMPIALVSLVDAERQWFKSRIGIDGHETPRDMAICAHAIHGDDVFQVTDALQDDRFADNPLVRDGPRLRFYAGVPLRLSTGAKVGTLCVLDYRPRQLDATQLAELRRLGALVVEQLEAG